MNIENLLTDLELEATLPSRVKAVRELLLDEHDLQVPFHCDPFICRCLRLKDGNTEKAVKLVKAFHEIIMDLKYWDTPRLPSLFANFYNVGTVLPLLKRDSLGRLIVIIRYAKWNPQVSNFDELLAGIWFMAQHVNAELIDVQRLGCVVILDCSKFSLEQAWAIKHMKAISSMRWVQNGIIGRIKALHIVSYPKIVRVIYSVLMPFMKEKFKKRINFHGNFESLHKQVGPEYLPKYLGGQFEEGEGIDKAIIKDLISKDEFFQDMFKNGFPDK